MMKFDKIDSRIYLLNYFSCSVNSQDSKLSSFYGVSISDEDNIKSSYSIIQSNGRYDTDDIKIFTIYENVIKFSMIKALF